MPLLQNPVDRNQGLERLHLIGKNRLPKYVTSQLLHLYAGPEPNDVHFHTSPEGLGGLVVPCIDNSAAHMLSFRGRFFSVGGFPNVDSELGLGSVVSIVSNRVVTRRIDIAKGKELAIHSVR